MEISKSIWEERLAEWARETGLDPESLNAYVKDGSNGIQKLQKTLGDIPVDPDERPEIGSLWNWNDYGTFEVQEPSKYDDDTLIYLRWIEHPTAYPFSWTWGGWYRSILDGTLRPAPMGEDGQMKMFASALQISVVDGDITQLPVDAIVNAANAQLILGSGVAGAIRQNGGPEIQAECNQKGPIQVGEAVETTAGNLPAKYVIHAATMAMGGGRTSAEIIYQATMSSLILADQLGCHSIAIPALGTGVGGFSLQQCADLMLSAVNAYSPSTLSQVIFAVWGPEAEQVFTQAVAGTKTSAWWEVPTPETDGLIDSIKERQTEGQPHQPTWTPSLSPGVINRMMQRAMYYHSCPECRGYFRDRGGVFTCDNCGYEYQPNE